MWIADDLFSSDEICLRLFVRMKSDDRPGKTNILGTSLPFVGGSADPATVDRCRVSVPAPGCAASERLDADSNDPDRWIVCNWRRAVDTCSLPQLGKL